MRASVLARALGGITLAAAVVTLSLVLSPPRATRIERVRAPRMRAPSGRAGRALAQGDAPAVAQPGQCALPATWDTTPMGGADRPAALIAGTGPWVVDGNQPFHFLRGGVLMTPWGLGRWTWAEGGATVGARLCGETWALRLHLADDGWSFEAERGDGHPPRRGKLLARRRALERVRRQPADGTFAAVLSGTGPWRWGGGGHVAFLRGGVLHTPWSSGAWKQKPPANGTQPAAVLASFLGSDHEIASRAAAAAASGGGGGGGAAEEGRACLPPLVSLRARDQDRVELELEPARPALGDAGPATERCLWKAEQPARPVVRAGSTELCEPPATRAEGSGDARPLNWLPSARAPFPANCGLDGGRLEPLCAALRRAAGGPSGREVLAAVSNKNIFDNLALFIDGLKLARIETAMVVALDEETSEFAEDRDVPAFLRHLRSRTGDTGNHATSGLKFRILLDFLAVGAHVLLSDVDVVWFEPPWAFLRRDADVEGMVDGWEDRTAFGHEMVALDAEHAAAGARSLRRTLRSMRVSHFNSGFFYVQPTHEARALCARVAARMAVEAVWDQTAFNEELFLPSHDGLVRAGALVRGVSYLCVLHSKMLFHQMRNHSRLHPAAHRPWACHVSWHPEKYSRMLDVLSAYHHGEGGALLRWPVPYEGLTDLAAEIEPANNASGERDSIVRARVTGKAARAGCDARAHAEAAASAAAAMTRPAGETGGEELLLSEAGALPGYTPPLSRIAGQAAGADGGGAAACLGRTAAETAHARARARDVLGDAAARWAEEATAARSPVLLAHCVGATAALLGPFAARLRPLGLDARAALLPLDGVCAAAAAAAAAAADAPGAKGSIAGAWAHILPSCGSNAERSPPDAPDAPRREAAAPSDPRDEHAARALACRWRVLGALLTLGVDVLSASVEVAFSRPPLDPAAPVLHFDADLELLSEGWDDLSAFGYDHVADDPPMGWSRFHHATRVGYYDPALALVQATCPARALCARMASRLERAGAGDVHGAGAPTSARPADEAAILNDEIFRPSRPGTPGRAWPKGGVGRSPEFTSVGAKVRVLNYLCFVGVRAAAVYEQHGQGSLLSHAVGARIDANDTVVVPTAQPGAGGQTLQPAAELPGGGIVGAFERFALATSIRADIATS